MHPTPPLRPNTTLVVARIVDMKMARYPENAQFVAGGLALGRKEESGRSDYTLILTLV